VAEGIDDMVDSTFGRIPGLVAMQPGAPLPLFSRIPAEWADEIQQIDGVRTVSMEVWQRVNVIDGTAVFSPPRFFFGTDIPTRLRLEHSVYREEMIAGRFLRAADRGTYNTIVSRQIAEEFNKGVGDTLRVNGHDLTIVGVYHCGSLMLDVAIILDIDQVKMMTRFDPNSVSGLYIEQDGSIDDEQLVANIRAQFRGREIERWKSSSALAFEMSGETNPLEAAINFLDRTLRSVRHGVEDDPDKQRKGEVPAEPGTPENNDSEETNRSGKKPRAAVRQEPRPPGEPASDDFTKIDEKLPIEVRTAVEWAGRFDKFSEDLDLFLMIITAIGVTVAVLSIVNTMLMSVTERIIEFGILKANGWSRFDVMKLITCESGVLGLGGGLLGSTFGWIATQIINETWPTRIQLFASPGLLLFAACFSTVLGILGGLYPAVWAMRMMPMDAIRRG